jgi:butyrate kinase
MAIYESDRMSYSETISHPTEILTRFSNVWQQYDYRLGLCRQWAEKNGGEYAAVASIGGLLRPVVGGVYHVNHAMLRDARSNYQGEHASNLGCALAADLALAHNVPAFVVDPVSVDEFEPLAYYSGHPCIKRRSLSHALNIHAAAQRASEELRLPLSGSNFIIAHLGGGISISPVRGGKIVDVNDAASDGPFSPERSGGLPLQPFIDLCVSGRYSEQELRQMVMGKSGLVAYLGTNSLEEVERRIGAGDVTAGEVLMAMAYQIAKEIGAMATVLSGNIDAIVLTGGAAHSSALISLIERRVQFLAPMIVYPGEDERQSLARRTLRVLRGEEQAKEY